MWIDPKPRLTPPSHERRARAYFSFKQAGPGEPNAFALARSFPRPTRYLSQTLCSIPPLLCFNPSTTFPIIDSDTRPSCRFGGPILAHALPAEPFGGE